MTMKLLGETRIGEGPAMLWLHGFTQTKDSAQPFRSILARHFTVITVDLPGHGENAGISASLPDIADLLAEMLQGEEVIVGGYSFGGRVALHLALKHPESTLALITLGATRGIASEEERAERREQDEKLASHIGEVGIDIFLEEWLKLPLFGNLEVTPEERASRSRDAEGLANSLRMAGTGTQYWLGHVLDRLEIPYLALAGERDEKFAAEAVALASAAQYGRSLFIPNASHAAHLEYPEACVQAILAP